MKLSILLAQLTNQYTDDILILRIDLDKHDDGVTLCVVSSHEKDERQWRTYWEYSNEGNWTYIECSIHTAAPVEVV